MLERIDEIFVRVAEFIRLPAIQKGLRLDVTIGIADISLAVVGVTAGQRGNDIFRTYP